MNHLRLTIVSLLVLAVTGQAMALDVKLTVKETAGVARKAEGVHGGVPLPAGVVTDVSKLRLLGPKGKPVAAQFRVLSRAQAGHVAWVAVSFLADVPANGSAVYRLTDKGAAPKPKAALKVAEKDDSVTVITGPLKVVVPKDRFAGLGQVWLDRNGDGAFADSERAATGGALVIEGVDGRKFDSIKDLIGPVTVRVLESGPLRAVIRIDGEMKAQSADDKTHTYPSSTYTDKKVLEVDDDVVLKNHDARLKFTAHLNFWAGRSQVRAFVAMHKDKGKTSTGTDKHYSWNTYFRDVIRKPGNFLVDSVSIELLLPAKGYAYRIGGGVGAKDITGKLGADGGVTLFQDTAASWLWQGGSGKIFDPRLAKNIKMMKTRAPDRLPYYEYQQIWYDTFSQKRDGKSFVGYRVYPSVAATKSGPGTTHKDLGKHSAEGMRAPGWVELDNGAAAVTFGCRWFWQMCPKDITVSAPGKISIGLWSRHKDRGHVFEGRAHKTHELLYDFSASGKAAPAATHFAAFDQRLLIVAEPKYLLSTGAFGDFMLPNKKDWPRMERSALTAVAAVAAADPDMLPGLDSSLEIEREKYDHYGVWRFGDHAKGGYHYFSQYLELDVPYCLMVHFARTGDPRFFAEADISCRQVLDVPAHGGGYGHQRGESSHFYTTGTLLYAFVRGEQWLIDSVLTSYKVANTRPWHLRSFGVTMWSSLDMYEHFPSARALARKKIDRCLKWWKGVQKDPNGRLGGFDRSWKTFFLGIGSDAMGRYCEMFPEDADARTRLVGACREWIEWTKTLEGDARKKIISMHPANGFTYAARFSGDQTFMKFVAENLVSDRNFGGKFRVGRSSAKGWSQSNHRLTQVYLHDVDKARHPERYK